jgi:SAM-dependent methyltransferase
MNLEKGYPVNDHYKGSTSNNRLLALVDHAETYGPGVVFSFLQQCAVPETVLDLGAGSGRDLQLARRIHPDVKTYAVEWSPENIATLGQSGAQVWQCDLETSELPFATESLDIVIANQVLEHIKELFWVVHEVTRVLKIGGHFIVGVPNVASLHNRVGLLFGKHPTQAKACSAHLRIFSKQDFLLFLEDGFPNGYTLEGFAGSQFYPFPMHVARALACLMPTAAFSIFFLLRKNKPYSYSFVTYPLKARLETNFRGCSAH